MIPSDHFGRFYNEILKFLEAKGDAALESFFLVTSKNHEKHILNLIQTEGLEGMEAYWNMIKVEENCDMDIDRNADRIELRMNLCPSLSKVLDNDATPAHRYCDHCAGWIGPIMDKSGYHMVYDVISRTEPRCTLQIYKDAAKARAAEADTQLLMGWPGHKLAERKQD